MSSVLQIDESIQVAHMFCSLLRHPNLARLLRIITSSSPSLQFVKPLLFAFEHQVTSKSPRAAVLCTMTVLAPSKCGSFFTHKCVGKLVRAVAASRDVQLSRTLSRDKSGEPPARVKLGQKKLQTGTVLACLTFAWSNDASVNASQNSTTWVSSHCCTLRPVHAGAAAAGCCCWC